MTSARGRRKKRQLSAPERRFPAPQGPNRDSPPGSIVALVGSIRGGEIHSHAPSAGVRVARGGSGGVEGDLAGAHTRDADR